MPSFIKTALAAIVVVCLSAIVTGSALAGKVEVKTKKLSNCGAKNSDNCVRYVRNNYIASLPSGLLTMSAKRSIINSKDAKKGRAAIINVGDNTGHIAYVVDSDSKGSKRSITIREANYPRCGIFERTASGKNVSMNDLEKALGIEGFYKP